jgi:myo-inositol catabolism protein IolC
MFDSLARGRLAAHLAQATKDKLMTLGYDGKLYILAFDHRGSFQKNLLGIDGYPSPAEAERVSDAKRILFEAFELALANGADRGSAGLLVDEEFGAEIAEQARVARVPLAMPVEKSGQEEFDFEFGDDFGSHIEKFDPTFAKVLVRYNPEGNRDVNRRQARRLRVLSEWLHERGRKLLFELLVPATSAQLEQVDGDSDRYDVEVRPGLLVAAIRELQEAGIEPDIWKIEGLDRREDCERVAAQARADGRDGVACIVLGRGADQARVRHWLEQGAGVPGYIGFAVGRTLWWDELSGFVAGRLDREETAIRIARNYERMIKAYAEAERENI